MGKSKKNKALEDNYSENPPHRVGPDYQVNIPASIDNPDRGPQLVKLIDQSPLPWDCLKSQLCGNCKDPGNEDKETKPEQSTALPGCTRIEAWTEIEKDSFVLGLHLIGNNFDLVKSFVGTKEMCYLYGKFQNSDAYNIWLECHESDNIGKELYCPWWFRTLLASLFDLIDHDFYDELTQSSRNFDNGTVSFEDYMFMLKNIAGMSVLLKVFGNGTGKKDLLTGRRKPRKRSDTALTPPKRTHDYPTGSKNVKISESEPRDLLAKTIWPDIEPRDKRTKDYKTPGLKGSTTKKRSKGEHYFDTVTAVLNEVTSQPQILKDPAKRTRKTKGKGLPDCTRDVKKSTTVDERKPHQNPLETCSDSQERNASSDDRLRKVSSTKNLHQSSSSDSVRQPSERQKHEITSSEIETGTRQDNGDSIMNRPAVSSEEVNQRQNVNASSNNQDIVSDRRLNRRNRSMTRKAIEPLENKLLQSEGKKK